MDNVVIVAIPDENDRVWKVSSEKIPHLTVLFLGEQVSNLEKITEFVEHAVNTTLNRFYLPVDRRGELGDDKADVLFFKKGRYDYKAIREFRATLLQDHNIKTAYDSAEQYENWHPHLTLGYPETPAKEIPDDMIDRFYDVCFNKIAIWTGDYDGPEFLLKEWGDIDEALDCMPMDVRMSNLEHHGVKGMRWGHRTKTPSVIEKPKNHLTGKQTAAVVGLGPYALLNRGVRENIAKNQAANAHFQLDKAWEKDFQKAKGFGFDDQKFTNDYNAKWKDHDFSKESWDSPSPKYKEYQDGYFKDMNTEYSKQFAEHYGSSPSGKYEAYHHPGTDLVSLRKKDTAQHAADDKLLVTFRIKLDDDGMITGLEKIEDPITMAQTVDLGAEFLEHHGVKGMKWGRRQRNAAIARDVATKVAPKIKSGAKSAASGAKTVTTKLSDRNFEQRKNSNKAISQLVSEAAKKTKEQDLPAINAKHKGLAKTSKNVNLIGPSRVPAQKAYRNEVRAAYLKRLEEVANSKTNKSGTKKYQISETAILGRKDATHWRVKTVDVKHAIDDLLDEFVVEPVFDDDGFIVDFKHVEEDPVEDTMIQTADLGFAFLEHHGIKGMRWGHRKEQVTAGINKAVGEVKTNFDPSAGGESSTVAPKATSVVPKGVQLKTQIKTAGGANHPASPDALAVAEARQKMRASGVVALSNKELKALETRLNLEANVKRLDPEPVSEGRKFINLFAGKNKKVKGVLDSVDAEKAVGFFNTAQAIKNKRQKQAA